MSLVADEIDARVDAAPRDVLRRVFGFPAFRGLQEAAVSRVIAWK